MDNATLPHMVPRGSIECMVDIRDISGNNRTLRAAIKATVQSVKKCLATKWRIPVICQKLLLTQASDAAPRLVFDHEMIADLQDECGMERLQLTLIASMDKLVEELRKETWVQDPFGLRSSTRFKLFRELLCAADWTQQGDDRIIEQLHRLRKRGEPSGRRVALLALARWSWKGDVAAHEEFIRYVEQYLTPSHVEQLQFLQLELDVEHAHDVQSPENPEVAKLMAAAITMGASQLDDSIGFYYWADIIAQMIPQGDVRAVHILCVALQQRRPSVRQIASVALQRLPWWNLQCTLAVLPRLAKGMTHKNGNVRQAALRMLTSVASRGWCKGWDALSDKDKAVFKASLEPVVACLTDSMPKIRYAAWAFMPHLRKIKAPNTSHACNNIRNTSVDWRGALAIDNVSRDDHLIMPSSSKPTAATIQQQSRLHKGASEEKESPCSNDTVTLQTDGSLSWCEEYYAIKADRRRAITRSRLRLGKQLQWRSNKHHRNSAANPDRKTSPIKPRRKGGRHLKPRRKGGRHHKVSSRLFVEAATASLPRRAPACELICPVDLYWALHGRDPFQRDDDANSCGYYSFCSDGFYDHYEIYDRYSFAEEYDWWKEARSAKIARSRIGKHSEIRRRPKTCSRHERTKDSRQSILTWKRPKRFVLASTETSNMAVQRLPRKATCETLHWREVWSPQSIQLDPHGQADAENHVCGASSVSFGCWLNLLLL
eukprot:gnl/MRDRNA2_/MRDRNA2_82728_c0_seq1.p1 gnl/MRDRNA2_/MRDRNA2_82728_c0~~gnl/MRDRNA2_/MRDRNA2_82728_c0_seq1.p1  ORF type:complete len:715 (+),score=98.38 gnl/MRDRNA2_/MRDRNA2_82728_c0_seq1:94-2238(+)